jgi:hypothetical protein
MAGDTVEIARIAEHVEFTRWGGFCLTMLLLNTIVTGLLFWSDNGAVRQAAWGTLFTGGTVLWGLGVALGVRRTYIITRQMPG